MSTRCRRGLFVVGISASFVGCTYDVPLGSVSYKLPATGCGTWDRSGVHTSGSYFVGHTTAPVDDTVSYFVFDLSPVQGRTVVTASLTIPGTDDWKITVNAPGETPPLQFMLGVKPLPVSLTLAQITGGSDDPGVYQDVQAEEDLGFGWDPSGSTTNTYGAFTYETERFQDTVNDGGLSTLFAVQGFGVTSGLPEYLYGGGVCGPGIVLTVTVE